MITEEMMTSKKSIADVMLKGVHKPEQEGVCKIINSKKKRLYIEPNIKVYSIYMGSVICFIYRIF